MSGTPPTSSASVSGMPNSSGSIDGSMRPCRDCGRIVPVANMMLHQLTACPGAPVHIIDRTPSPKSDSEEIEPNDGDDDVMDVEMDDRPNGSKYHSGFRKTGDSDDDDNESVNLLASDNEDMDRSIFSATGVATGVASVPVSMPGSPDQNQMETDSDDGRASRPEPIDLSMSPDGLGPRRRRQKHDRSNESFRRPVTNRRGQPKRDNAYDSPNERRRGNDSDDDTVGSSNDRSVEVVDLSNSPENSGARSRVENVDDDDDDDGAIVEEWACPQCTLLNPISARNCDACNFRNPHIERDPDPVRTERLIDGSFVPDGLFSQTSATSSLPMGYISSGAIIGSVLGGAGSFLQGRPVVSGMAEGAISGAVGGVAIGSALQTSPSTTRRREPDLLEQARTSGATGLVSYPSTDLFSDRLASRMRARRSVRIQQIQDGNVRATIIRSGNGDLPSILARRRSGGDPFLDLIRRHQFGGGGLEESNVRLLARQLASRTAHPSADLDGMSYEQLLSMFGDGSENMGASASQISQFPTAVVTDPERELPEGSRECSVCLEAFEAGQERKTLPCLHGFHSECIDKWLVTNASCPICKHRVNDQGDGD